MLLADREGRLLLLLFRIGFGLELMTERCLHPWLGLTSECRWLVEFDVLDRAWPWQDAREVVTGLTQLKQVPHDVLAMRILLRNYPRLWSLLLLSLLIRTHPISWLLVLDLVLHTIHLRTNLQQILSQLPSDSISSINALDCYCRVEDLLTLEEIAV